MGVANFLTNITLLHYVNKCEFRKSITLIGSPYKLRRKRPASLSLKIQGGQKLCYFVAKITISYQI